MCSYSMPRFQGKLNCSRCDENENHEPVSLKAFPRCWRCYSALIFLFLELSPFRQSILRDTRVGLPWTSSWRRTQILNGLQSASFRSYYQTNSSSRESSLYDYSDWLSNSCSSYTVQERLWKYEYYLLGFL